MKTISIVLICTTLISGLYCVGSYTGSTTACVTLAGAVIKAQHSDVTKKYKRSECPVCKGKGWYISGDGIAKVDCGYCEPSTEAKPSEITHPPIIMKSEKSTPARVFRK